MKARNLALAGAGALLLGAAAHGSFVGIAVEEVGTYNDGATDWTTYHLFAEFDDSNDQLGTVYAFPYMNPLYIASTGALGFYQDLAFGGDIEHNRLLDGLFPGLANDSFMTIGRNDTQEGGADTTALVGTSPGQTASFNAGGPLLVTNGGWVRSLSDVFNEPFTFASHVSTSPHDNEFRVMFAQLTIESSASFDPTSRINIWVKTGGQNRLFRDVLIIPAPGTLALLGVAGLVRRRRRR